VSFAPAWPASGRILASPTNQSGEPGPFAACIAGIDVALSDLAARKAGLPLWKMLGRSAKPEPVMAYASNLNPTGAPEYVAMCRERGYRAFKLKVAFDMKSDPANVREIAAGLRAGERFMIDANQGWTSRLPDLRSRRSANFRRIGSKSRSRLTIRRSTGRSLPCILASRSQAAKI
jgi:D-galactarolactone cycloisomerase